MKEPSENVKRAYRNINQVHFFRITYPLKRWDGEVHITSPMESHAQDVKWIGREGWK